MCDAAEFKSEAMGLLNMPNKIKIGKPFKNEMKAEFMDGFPLWLKEHPHGNVVQYAAEFMKKHILGHA